MNETRMFKFRTALFFVFIWLFMCKKGFCVEPTWMGKNTFDGEETGIIRDIAEIENQVFVGAENGLFRITGNKTIQYSKRNSPLGKGYITDLYVDKNTLYITEFGNGVFTFLPEARVFSRVDMPTHLARNAWASMPFGEFVAVSTLSKIILVPLSGGVPKIKEQLENGDSMKGIYSLTIHDDTLVVSEANHILFLNSELHEIGLFDRQTYFPKLKKITYVKSIDGTLFIGGIGGVYTLDKDHEIQFYPASVDSNQLKDVESIIKDSEGHFWVAAGGLFLLNQEDKLLEELPFSNPRFSFDQIRAVQSIYQLANKQFLIASTQLGLLSIDLNTPPFNYLHETSFPYRQDIYTVVPDGQGQYLAKTSDKWFWLNSTTGKLKYLDSSFSKKSLIPIGEHLLLPDEKCNASKPEKGRFIQSYKVMDKAGYCKYLKPHSYVHNNEQFIYYQASGHAGFIKLDNGGLQHHVNAPKDLRFLLSSPRIPAIVLDKNNALYLMEDQGVWIKHDLEELRGTYTYCMYADSTSIYLCTSGKGLKRFDIATKTITDAFPEHEIPRFIRAGFMDAKGNHWLATNKGFVFLNERNIFEFDNSDGIADTDFNYKGILPLTAQKFLMVGDQLTYLIDTDDAIKYIAQRRSHIAHANITKIQVSTDDSETQLISLNEEMKLGSIPDEIIFEFASADFVYSKLHKLEYRLVGFHDEWQELSDNVGTVAYSGIGFGEFEFQVRVIDHKSTASQPINSHPFTIATPFWFTWKGYLLYLLFAVMAIGIIILAIKWYLAEKSRVLANIIHQKQSALMESNRSISALLDKKEKIFSNLASEIKTPVMQILNPVSELRAEHLTSNVRRKVDLVYNSAGRLRVLMDQLAAVYKIEHISDKISQRYDIAKTIDFLVETLRPRAIQKQLVINCDYQVRVPVMLVQDSLEAMMNNLLLNAITYTRQRGQIKIKACCQADRLILKVQDNGPGLSKDELEFVISRFTRGANHSGKTGMGIGLNLTNELALANNGWVEMSSQPDEGTEVSLNLPFEPVSLSLQVKNSDDVTVAIREVAEKQAEYQQNNLPVVLVLERSQEACEYLISLIDTRFNCYSLQSGIKALDIIPVLRPDIILTELNIPDISGISFTEKLREVDGFADLPVMILTAESDYNAKIKSFKASVNDYLIKPVDREELMSRIDSHLRLSRLSQLNKDYDRATETESDATAYVKAILPKCNNEKERKFIVRFLEVIEENYSDEKFSRKGAAKLLAVSERQLNRLLAKLLPDNFTLFLKKYRLEKSMPMLEEGMQITQIAFEVGFGSAAYFSRCFKQEYGCLPSEMAFTLPAEVECD